MESQEALQHGEGFLARINHPIFGAFAASWLVWNWEIPYILIRGLGIPKETIAEINVDYLNSAHLWNILWLPLLMTTAFLVLGPVLRDGYSTYREFIKVIWNWADMKLKGFQPVPASQLKELEKQMKQAQEERGIYQNALNLLQNKSVFVPNPQGEGGTNVPAEEVTRTYFAIGKDNQTQRNEISQLKAQLLKTQDELERLKKGSAGK